MKRLQDKSRVCGQPAQQAIFYLLFGCLAAVFPLLFPQAGYTCGLVWYQAHAECHFDGVDNQGNVFLIQKLGEMESVKGYRLPFYAVFNSESGNRSPFVGYGWSVPLLESRIVQVDENRYCVFQPDGFQRMFGRDRKDPTLLLSRDTWKAEIREETITAWCRCQTQGNKLVFRKGRLVSMVVKDEEFDYVYDGDRVAEIREGGRTVLKVVKNPLTGGMSGLTLINGQTIGLELSKRPLVQVIDKQNLVGGTMQSLSKIILTDGTIRTFRYGMDENFNPTLKLSDREIVWDAATGKIIRDGEWTYGITLGDNAAIARTNAQNQIEFWHKNYAKGEEITEGIDGIRKIKTWFTSGKLRGRTRKEMEIKNGVKKILNEYSYDEKGRLIRIRREKTDTFMVYEENGELAGLVQNGELIRNYTTNGTFLAEKYVR